MLGVVPFLPGIRPPHHRRPLGEPLLEDWARLSERCLGLGAVLTTIGFAPTAADRACVAREAAGDRALAEMVRRAASDPLAARIVLQRLLPGLLAIARRRGPLVGGPHAALDELMTTGWIVIRCYPIDRRGRQVAAGLLRDIEYRAFVASGRRAMTRREIPTRSLGEDGQPEPSPYDEVVIALRDGLDAGMQCVDVRFAGALASGATLAALAAARGVDPRTERYRRARVVDELRRATLGCDA